MTHNFYTVVVAGALLLLFVLSTVLLLLRFTKPSPFISVVVGAAGASSAFVIVALLPSQVQMESVQTNTKIQSYREKK